MKFDRLCLSILLAVLFAGSLFAQTGKIAGTVIDGETGEGLPFANVLIDGTSLGAATDLEGNFTILNVKPGVYSVTASIVGFQKQTITDTRVNSDFTTRLEFELTTGSIEMEAVIVQGERNPLIRQDLTNPTVAITGETIDELPVDQISDVIRMQAGVAVGNDGQLHFRGGYGNEVAYTLNGVSLNDPYGNNRSIGLATNAVQEVSVSTGTFSAEYGNALSGVVNYITREGDDDYTFSIRGYGGDYITSRTDLFENIDDIDPLNRTRGEFTFGGPFPLLRGLNMFFSGVYENYGGLRYGRRIYSPTDSYILANEFDPDDARLGSSTEPYYFNPYDPNSNGLPTGDGEYVAMNTSENFNLQGNISYRFTPTLKLKYEAVFNQGESDGGGNWGYFESKYNPDGRGKSYSTGIHNALEFTHTVSQNVFYTLKGSYTINEGKYYLFEDFNDPGYLPGLYAGRTLSNTSFLTGGTDNYRFNRETKAMGLKGDMVAQLWNSHEIKLGFEARTFKMNVESYSIEFGKFDANSPDNFGTLNVSDMFDPNTQIIRRIPSTPNLYTYYEREPTTFAVYLRDKIELHKSLILNAGIRYEYFDPNALYNDNISTEYQEQKEGEFTQNLKEASVKHMISPRFSVSYPITDQGIIRFSYGHFYQNGSLASLYRNPNFYASLGSSSPSFGNPDVEPQKSIQYEMGLLQGLTEDLRLEFTGYYKDVTDYIYTSTIFTEQGKEFRLLTNLAYSNVRGVTLSLFKRRGAESMFQMGLDYTFQIAEGNRTEPSEDLFYSEASGKSSETYLVPLSFDRAHIINATVNLIDPNNWSLGLVGYLQTGTPYTPSLPAQLSAITYEQNSAARPIQYNLDLKFEKYFTFGDLKYSVFVHVENLFDVENETYVWSSSGRALSSVEESINANVFNDLRNRIERGDAGLIDEEQLDDYYKRVDWLNAPREIRLGFSIIFN
ncbi:MAG: hypothetical protein SCALA702_17210 [Melioribacteraceae bacterium]|nr:MAG: hypothetical protein SCALA702_17210 [Melioribacteraceae bacterium]